MDGDERRDTLALALVPIPPASDPLADQRPTGELSHSVERQRSRARLSSGDTSELDLHVDEPFELLGFADVDDAPGEEAFVRTGGASFVAVAILTVDRGRLVLISPMPAGESPDLFEFFTLKHGGGTNHDAGVRCGEADGKRQITVLRTRFEPAQGERPSHWQWWESTYGWEGKRPVLVASREGTLSEAEAMEERRHHRFLGIRCGSVHS